MQSSYHTRSERHPEKYDQPPDTERARMVVDAVYRFGVLTQAQIERLFFGGKASSRATHLLAQFFHHGILDRRSFSPIYPLYYSIGENAPDYLNEKLGRTDVKYSPFKYKGKHDWFLHQREITDVCIALTRECQKYGYQLQCLGDKELPLKYQRPTAQGTISVNKYLDEYFIITDPAGTFPPLHLGFEMDRGTHYLDTFGEKIFACLVYMKSGKHHARYKTASLRILTITSKGAIRVRRLKHKTEVLGGKNRFWFATLDDAMNRSILFDPIWHVASGGEQPTHLITRNANRVAA